MGSLAATLQERGVTDIFTESTHGYPFMVEGIDRQERPFFFRVRGVNATLWRGVYNEAWESMLDNPDRRVNVTLGTFLEAGILGSDQVLFGEGEESHATMSELDVEVVGNIFDLLNTIADEANTTEVVA